MNEMRDAGGKTQLDRYVDAEEGIPRRMTEKQFERFLRDYAKKVEDGTAKPEVTSWLMTTAADHLEAYIAIGAALMRSKQ